MERKQRLEAVRKALLSGEVAGQEELKARLSKAGVKTSQASLSRDLKSLGAQRARHPDKGWVYTLPPEPPAAPDESSFRRRFKASVRGVRRSSFILVLLTPPGEASLVGRLIDEARVPGLIGAVAGDDTILCVAGSEAAAKKTEKEWKEILS